MITISVSEAKTHFSALLDRAAKGERITITRRGMPVATLEPIAETPEMTVDEALAVIEEIGRGKSLGGLTIKQLIEEGRR
jgi:prevent-host-death family protein